MSVITIAAALLHDGAGRLLLVRKRGTQAFMQPGGKIEPDETPLAALLREIDEELGIQPEAGSCHFIRQIEAPAANEPGHVVRADLFALPWSGPIVIAAEIEEACWVTPEDAQGLILAPLTREYVLPLYASLS